MHRTHAKRLTIPGCILVVALGLSPGAFADEHLIGVIAGRTDTGALMVRIDTAMDIVVNLNEATKVRQRSGLRSRKVDVPSLIPGLRINAEGTFDNSVRFNADRISFTTADLKTALAVQAALVPTDQAVQENRAAINAHEQQIQQGAQRLEQHDLRLAATDEKISATSGAIANPDD